MYPHSNDLNSSPRFHSAQLRIPSRDPTAARKTRDRLDRKPLSGRSNDSFSGDLRQPGFTVRVFKLQIAEEINSAGGTLPARTRRHGTHTDPADSGADFRRPLKSTRVAAHLCPRRIFPRSRTCRGGWIPPRAFLTDDTINQHDPLLCWRLDAGRFSEEPGAIRGHAVRGQPTAG